MTETGSSSSRTRPLLAARELRKSYRMGRRNVEVLQGATLEVGVGEFVALRGASGSGKSTLLHLLGGLDVPDSGSIEFDGAPLAKSSAAGLAAFRNMSVGFVFQAYHLLPELDALENVCLPARVARRSVGETEQRARELLGRVGLSSRLDHRPAELSGGEQQRVAIARALINRPRLVLADEPTGNLDSHTGSEIMELLTSLRTEHGTALVLVTHDPRVAARAPRTLELEDGRVRGA
ncbi:MAG: ABC transporter ATP-binding protein [Verrucomicrobiales bacterium]|jgi:lipoprotein-releasing system ATP-binding protein|nr:ABC transporter ATP-binding protein [Verrucomicrobiales bacterium]